MASKTPDYAVQQLNQMLQQQTLKQSELQRRQQQSMQQQSHIDMK